jgi:hypothetical protein
MSKFEDALNAPMDAEPKLWLWRLAANAKPAPKKLPPGFEDAVITGLARAADKLGEPKNGWGIGFSTLAETGSQLLPLCPTERLARCVLGLAALSGIGGEWVTAVRKLKSKKAIAAALADFDEREEDAHSYPAMRKAMTGYCDEVLPHKKPKKKAKPNALRLHLVNGRVIANESSGAWAAYREALRATTGPKRKGKDERRLLKPADVPPKEREQLVGILAKAFGLKEKSFGFDDIFSGKAEKDEDEVLAETAQTPIEWWDVVDDAKKVRYQLWTYHADCGSLVEAGTSKRVASIIQFGFGVEEKDPDHQLARAMEAAHTELRKRCPKSEIAGMDFSVDDD